MLPGEVNPETIHHACASHCQAANWRWFMRTILRVLTLLVFCAVLALSSAATAAHSVSDSALQSHVVVVERTAQDCGGACPHKSALCVEACTVAVAGLTATDAGSPYDFTKSAHSTLSAQLRSGLASAPQILPPIAS